MSGSPPLDQRYLEWLYSLVGPSNRRYPARYWKLCEQLYKTQFTWFVPNDDNRIVDARELRDEYLYLTGEEDRLWYEMEASVIEVLISVSRRIGFELDEAPGLWFWTLIDHLGLTECTDDDWDRAMIIHVRETTNRLLMRTYRSDGYGGLFPLRRPIEDQRDVEIWYQMSAYLLELMP